MALAGSAVLAIWNGIKPDAEDEFVAWHVREHIPERVGVPGFLRSRRYIAVDGNPKYFNFYETTDAAVLTSPAYLERLNAPSRWTKSVVAHFTDTSRTVCNVAFSYGVGDGAALLTVQLSTAQPVGDFTEALRGIVYDVLKQPGIVAAHLLQGDATASTLQTAEKKLRDRADEIVSWVLLVDAVGPDALERLETNTGLASRLVGAGADPAMRKGIYALQYALSENQLEPKRRG